MIHELKILPEYFEEVCLGNKTFEIRKNDRNFHAGDWLLLKEWNPETGYTGYEILRYVSYILYDWQAGLKDGYCIMALKRDSKIAVLD